MRKKRGQKRCYIIMEQRELLEQLFQEAFQPEDYVNTFYKSLDPEVEFFLTNLHHYFDSRVTESAASSETRRRDVLEIGSGPVPISMISASRWSEWIVCSDFLERNRLEMSNWLLAGGVQSGVHDYNRTWLPFSRFVYQLERPHLTAMHSSEEDGSSLLNRVRRSVRAVLPCNVLSNDPLMGCYTSRPSTSDSSLFDVIITTLCLEFAATSPTDYSIAVKNVVNLLRPSGHLIMQGALENSHYWLNNSKFPSVSLNRSLVEAALKEAGCKVLEWKELERCCPVEDKPADHSAVFYCLSTKI